MAYAGTDQGSRAFSANLRGGRPAVAAGSSLTTRFEVPRSAGFRFDKFTREGATLTLVYLPPVFSFQPATTDAEDIAFLCLPPTWWVDEQAKAIRQTWGEDAREAAIAAYFVAYLDQRSPLPIANDLGFHLKLYRAALEEPWCQTSFGSEWSPGTLFHLGLETVGFETALCCKVDHPDLRPIPQGADGCASSLTKGDDRPWQTQSVALGGYFPTPSPLLPSLASLVSFAPQDEAHILVDPVAGDAAAIAALRTHWFDGPTGKPLSTP